MNGTGTKAQDYKATFHRPHVHIRHGYSSSNSLLFFQQSLNFLNRLTIITFFFLFRNSSFHSHLPRSCLTHGLTKKTSLIKELYTTRIRSPRHLWINVSPPPKKFGKGSVILLLQDGTKVAVNRNNFETNLISQKKETNREEGTSLTLGKEYWAEGRRP